MQHHTSQTQHNEIRPMGKLYTLLLMHPRVQSMSRPSCRHAPVALAGCSEPAIAHSERGQSNAPRQESMLNLYLISYYSPIWHRVQPARTSAMCMPGACPPTSHLLHHDTARPTLPPVPPLKPGVHLLEFSVRHVEDGNWLLARRPTSAVSRP